MIQHQTSGLINKEVYNFRGDRHASSGATAIAAVASISPSSAVGAAAPGGAVAAICGTFAVDAVCAVCAVCAIGTGENTKAIAMGASLLTIPVACIVINGDVATF